MRVHDNRNPGGETGETSWDCRLQYSWLLCVFLSFVAYQLLNASNSLQSDQRKGKGRGESDYFVNV